MILPFTVRPSEYIRMIRENRKLVITVMILQTVINYVLFYMGINLVPGALGAVIVGSQPLVTAVVAAMMHREDKLTRAKMITIIFGISGVIIISVGRQAFKLGTAIEFLGVLLILAANIATAVSNVVVSLKSKGMNPLVLSSASLGMGGILIYILSIPLEGAAHPSMPLNTGSICYG